ncbi:MAG: DUF3137 domain-containing protein [Phycisphaerae bacterium]|nr:DUF3137 domain-containing protein [Phycisphaerae bacterium]
MKTLDELRDFYSTSLSADLRQLEAKRRQVMNNSLIAGGVVFVLGLIGGGVIMSQGAPPVVLVFVLIGCIVVGAIAFGVIGRGYKAQFKQKIVGKLVRFMDPGLSYQPEGGIEKPVFKASGLFKHKIDRYKAEDLVVGRAGKTDLRFSEVHAEYKTGSGKDTTWHTIFRGLFSIADFNKHFRSQTVVLPDTAEKLFGGFGKMLQGWNIARADLIQLEDPEFEREFVVYGSDQIEARYILSPALMQRILDFQQKTGTKIYLSFTGSNVYVALPMTKNCFEPKYFDSVTDFAPIAEYYHDLCLVIGIVEDLNLNTRIWTKE